MKIKVKVETKSNFRELNGLWLNVIEMNGTRVSCLVDGLTVDFNLVEIKEVKTYK